MAKKEKRKPATSEARLKPHAVTVRIRPASKDALDLLSRAHHQPISQVFEWCLDVATRLVDVTDSTGAQMPLAMVLTVYRPEKDDLTRAFILAARAPGLMDHEQKAMCEAVKNSPELLSDGGEQAYDPSWPGKTFRHANVELILANFDRFKQLANERYGSTERAPITIEELTRNG